MTQPRTVARQDDEDLYRLHRARILRLCRLLLANSAEADDVAQEVFVKLLAARRDGNGPRTAGAWLTEVTVNACRDRRRSGWWWRWWSIGEELDERAVPSPARTPEEGVLALERRGRIWRSWRRLPARQREIFALRTSKGWPPPTSRASSASAPAP